MQAIAKTDTTQIYGLPCNILVVDHETQFSQLVAQLFHRKHRVLHCSSGDEALRQMSEKAPDLIVLDLGLPDVDGLDMCRAIRDNPRLRGVLLLAITASSKQETYMKALDFGADDFLPKPVELPVLEARVHLLLRYRRAKLALQSAHEQLESRVEERTQELLAANDDLRREIAERKRIENELRRNEEHLRLVQRMEAIGRLAGGVAHDFNNLLMIILGNLDLAMGSMEGESEVKNNIAEARRAADRAATLTRQLLAFGRKQILQPKVLDLNALVVDVGRMLSRIIGETIELVVLQAKGLGRIKADAAQLEQVILNLAINARDAMPAGGRLTIETYNAELDEAYAASHVSVRPGSYVTLSVSDTGIGMDAETKLHVFEPFFTTKEVGKGTGLGLATIYGIVKQSGGNIWVYSEPGKGSTFKVYLPRVTESGEVAPVPVSRPAPQKGNETILLVEDELGVRDLVREMLVLHGYTVLEASNGQEALQISSRYYGKIHLLLSDIVMPQMGGPELAEKLRADRGDLKVIFMSGYTEQSVHQRGFVDPGITFIGKPFETGLLCQKIRDLLDK